MVYLKVSLLGYNKLIILDIDAGVAAWTGGGGGGGGEQKLTLTSIEDTSNSTCPYGYLVAQRSSPYSAGTYYMTSVTKTTIGGSTYIFFSQDQQQKSSQWYNPIGYFSTNGNPNDQKICFKANNAVIQYLFRSTSYVHYFYFLSDAFDFNIVTPVLNPGSSSITPPFQISSVVFSTDPTTDPVGTDLTFTFNTNAIGRPYYTDSKTANWYLSDGSNTHCETQYNSNGWYGLKSNNSIILWFKGGFITFYAYYFNFSSVLPNFYQ